MFDFVDLFAGVGGFHSAMTGLGGRGVQAAEIDAAPARVYNDNWQLQPDSDVRLLARNAGSLVRDHAVLTGGFPCQPFSKSGRQMGIAEERGTLFHEILRILEAKTPPVVMLENVRNLAGPRQRDAWRGITHGLRQVGYRVSDAPCVFSPHLLPPHLGGAAQIRERVYILGVLVGPDEAVRSPMQNPVVENRPVDGWDPNGWSVAEHVLLPNGSNGPGPSYAVSALEADWINTWNELICRLGSGVRLPGFPMWEPYWRVKLASLKGLPSWKQNLIRKNHSFYLQNQKVIDDWRGAPRATSIAQFPLSRRKLEWQAQDAKRDLWQQLIQFRPSGIRVKRPTYVPALVAMNQTPVYGPLRRRLTPLEVARLQGFDPSTFSFGDQSDAFSYKQMGNAVNVGAVRHVFREFVRQNESEIAATGRKGQSIIDSLRLSEGRAVA